MSDMKGSEANPAGYVLIGKAGLSRPLGITEYQPCSFTALKEEYAQSTGGTSDVAPPLSQERIYTLATLKEYQAIFQRRYQTKDMSFLNDKNNMHIINANML